MGRKTDSENMSATLNELRALVVAYLKQETIVPVKALGRYVAFGMTGMTVMAAGLVLLLVAGLRAAQTEGGSVFTGHLSWAPYGICAFAAMVVLGLAAAAIAKGRGQHSPGATRRRGSPPGSPKPTERPS